MRIKSIQISGFKTFADNVVIEFSDSLSTIVGPNGCGKSNLFDAFSWVLGESSAKQLRGEQLQDVIFKGTNQRKATRSATVKIIFDNRVQKIDGPYAKDDFIAVKRSLDIDGNSYFYINNQSCRRRDIIDLVAGTGIGPRSYAMIEQGMMSRITLAKPEELRQYIEEAANIARYRDKKRESVNKMAQTKSNLERIEDNKAQHLELLEDLGRQIQITKKYRKLVNKLRTHQKFEALLALQHIQSNIAKIQNEQQHFEVKKEQINASIEQLQHQMTTNTKDLADNNDKLNNLQAQFYQCTANLKQLEDSVLFTSKQQQNIQSELQANLVAFNDNEQKIAAVKTKSATLTADIDNCNTKQKTIVADINNLDAEHRQLEPQLKVINAQLLEYSQQYSELKQQANAKKQQQQDIQSNLQSIGVKQASLNKQLTSINEEIATTESQQADITITDIEQLLTTKKEQLDDLQKQLQHCKKQHNQLAEQQLQLQSLYHSHKVERDAIRQLELVEANDRELQQLIKSKAVNPEQLLFYHCKQIPQQFKAIISHVLGSLLMAYRDSDASNLAKFDNIPNILTKVEPKSKQAIPYGHNLTEYITTDFYPSLFDNIILVSNKEQALKNREQLANTQIAITAEGLVIANNWQMQVAIKQPENTILQRQDRIDSLTTEIQQIEDKLQTNNREKEQLQDTINLLTTQLDTIHLDVDQLKESKLQATAQAQELKIKNSQKSFIEQQLTEIQQQREQLKQQLKQTEAAQQQLTDKLFKFDNEYQQIKTNQSQVENQLSSIQNKLTQVRKSHFDIQQQINLIELQRVQSQSQITHLKQAQQTQLASQKKLQQQLQQIDQSQTNQQDIDQLVAQRNQIETAIIEQKQNNDSLNTINKKLNDDKFKGQHQLDSLTEQLHQKQILLSQYQTEEKQLHSQVDQSEMQQLAEQLPTNLTSEDNTLTIAQLKNKIEKIGDVNLAAEQQHQLQQQKIDYIETQIENLQQSVDLLQNAITHIDKESTRKFKQTFDLVNQNFTATFKELFGGGDAKIVLTSDDLQNCGLVIKARPIGKKMSALSLLSGGEKTLTALSFIFAIFKINPAPFCLLDEVDAPLDDSNVNLYNTFLKNMSQSTQFITVTHNKITMAASQLLIGVTMREPGVSRIVSVDLQQAMQYSQN